MLNRLSRPTAILLLSLFAYACVPQLGKTPTILASPTDLVAGTIVRVTGTDWKAGERVEIGLKTPQQSPRDSQPVADVLTDASGRFVAVFSFPGDVTWPGDQILTIVAHNSDWSRTGQTTVRHAIAATSVPAPTPTSSSTSTAILQVRVLGYVENLADGSGIIKLRAVEGPTDVLVIGQQTQVTTGGQASQLSDIRIGDLIEAAGQMGTNNRLVVTHIRIIVQNTVLPPPTATLVPAGPSWRGEYYSNTTFSGRPVLVREDPVIDFHWRDGAPAPELPSDGFTVRWTGTWPLETGVYRFFAQVDDGVRLWIGQQLVIDQWHEGSGALYSTDAYVSAGPQTVKVEYLESQANALARVWWEFLGPDATPITPEWKGSYFAGMSLSGQPLFVLNERLVDFNWGAGSPFNGFPADQFSVRWTRSLYLDGGVYRFYASADDGVRVIVNGTTIIDRWRDGGVETFAGDLVAESDIHMVTVEYYENGGQAVMRLWWELVPSTATPTPTSSPSATPILTPTPEPTGSATPGPAIPTPSPTDVSGSTTPTAQPQPTETLVSRPASNALVEAFVPQVSKGHSKALDRALAVRPGGIVFRPSAWQKHVGGFYRH